MSCFCPFKAPGDITIYPCVGSDDIWFLRYLCDGQTDGWMEKSHIEVGALHCFPLKIYGFCSSNALYLESLQSVSTRMVDFFVIWDHYYFESNLSLELLIKVFLIKKLVTFFLSLLKRKKEFCHMKLFLCSSGISLG